MEKTKVIAIASRGGHWIQLMQLGDLLKSYDTKYVTTDRSLFDDFNIANGEVIGDFNRDTPLLAISSIAKLFGIIFKYKPDYIITTGAAPGLACIVLGRLLGAKGIWIDSIANAHKLSLSGKLSVYFSTFTLTQWEELSEEKVIHKGKLLE